MNGKPWLKEAHKKLVESCRIKQKEEACNGKDNENSTNSKNKPVKKKDSAS